MLSDLRLCHLVVGVTDVDRSLDFYRGLLGMEVVFDQLISGEPFDAILHASRQAEGRVVGGVVGGVMLELVSLGTSTPSGSGKRGFLGNQNIALSVTDLDATYRAVVDAGFQPAQEPFPIDRVRMFFVNDPDGTAVEFVEFPGGARSSYEMHRGTELTAER
ncbi:VOC family protein [Mycolicibacterium septicum DSM 44393]|uniref:VOC family protein n=1 Tax=Mycolicibacterium septicum DSM 44393 TaxID=1341646 RepID=A0A7X6RV09_9MYCO|nr:VOC family protein [Mycolicibacterium septicum]NKZ10899.1 VOC family protein [Mycolicibacterium septicum DSM 44393]